MNGSSLAHCRPGFEPPQTTSSTVLSAKLKYAIQSSTALIPIMSSPPTHFQHYNTYFGKCLSYIRFQYAKPVPTFHTDDSYLSCNAFFFFLPHIYSTNSIISMSLLNSLLQTHITTNIWSSGSVLLFVFLTLIIPWHINNCIMYYLSLSLKDYKFHKDKFLLLV